MKRPASMILVCAVFAAATAFAQMRSHPARHEAPNLVRNGNFDDSEDPLNHWIYVFDHNKHYMKNHTHVSVEKDRYSTRARVLKLDASDHNVCVNQGVMVYTAPIRYNPRKSYKISLSARSEGVRGGKGPTCRVYPIAYRWHPRAVKSDRPAFSDLREDVRFQPIYFDGKTKTGPFSMVPSKWTRASCVIPDPNRTEMQQHHLENCQWLMLKIVALDAHTDGYLYISDVKIQEVGDANEVTVRAGSQTKSFTHGQTWGGSRREMDSPKKLTPVGGPHPVRQGGKK